MSKDSEVDKTSPKVDVKEAENDSDDEDYDPDNNGSDGESQNGEDSEDEEVNTKKEIKGANYSKIESSVGGLIKTRSQRLKETSGNNDTETLKILQGGNSINSNVDSIWAEMRQSGKEKSPEQKTAEESEQDNKEEKIKIKRSYEYAGETIHEEKWVLRSSAEAKAYLNSVKIAQEKSEAKETGTANAKAQGTVKPRVFKRKKSSIVDNIIKSNKMAKLNTLEKSRLDWANYVDNNNLNDELTKHNKDGYLSKQDFLHTVERNLDTKMKQGKKG